MPAAGPPPDILSQLPADAPVVAYIDAANLRTLQNSPLAAALGLASPGPQADRDYANFVRDTGFDYTRDLDHAAIAVLARQFRHSPDNVDGEDRVLAIADGRFDQQKIKAYAAATGNEMQLDRTRPLVTTSPEIRPSRMTFLSPTRIALASGDRDELLAHVAAIASDTLRHRATPPCNLAFNASLARRCLRSRARDRLPQSIYAPLHNSPQLEQIARSVQAVTLAGQPDRDNLKITIDAECDSLKNAVQLAFLLETGKMAGSMALSDPRTRRQMTQEQYVFLQALLNHATINHQNKVVRITLQITPDMLSAAPAPPSKPAATPRSSHAARSRTTTRSISAQFSVSRFTTARRDSDSEEDQEARDFRRRRTNPLRKPP